MKPNKRGNEEYGSFAGEICLILDTVYRSSRRRFQAEAKARGISLESLAAAAIAHRLGEGLPAIRLGDTGG